MLESLRTAQGTWVGKAVMGLIFALIIVGLSFFGFADLFRTARGNWVAKIGDTEISASAFNEAYQNGLRQLQQRLRSAVTAAQARQFGLDQQVLSRLVTDAVIDNEAAHLRLAISDQQIAKMITTDPTFVGSNGQFDRERFNALLRDNGLNEQRFVQDQRKFYVRQELEDAIAGAMTSPAIALEAMHRYQSETRSVDLIVLTSTGVAPGPAPSDADLQAFYNDRKQQFASPESRKIVYLALTPADVAKPDAVTDEDMHRAYDTAPDTQFGSPEQRQVEQIVFPTDAEAQAASQRIASGTRFADVAAERNVSGKDLDLGTVTKAQIFDPAVADAAFALPADGTSGPVKGRFGTVLVHVNSITPGSRKPFDEVAPLLRQAIATSPARTRDALRDVRDKIEDSRSSGKALTDAAKAVGLDVKTVDGVDATGHLSSGALADMPDREQVLKAAFASDVGVDNDVIQTRTGEQIWFEVAAVVPAKENQLADVKPKVLAAWEKDDMAKRLAVRAEDLAKQWQAGATVEQVATLAGTQVRHVGDLRRSGNTDVPQPVTLKAFDTPVGSVGTAQGEGDARVVLKVYDSAVPVRDPDAPDAKKVEAQYRDSLANDVLTSFLTRLQGEANVKIDPTVLNAAMGGSN